MVDAEALDLLLAHLVDSFEKIEIVACLHERGPEQAMTAASLADRLKLPAAVVARELSDLYRAGLVATVDDDEAGWWLDQQSGWNEVLDTVLLVYKHDRRLLLRRMAVLAIRELRANRQRAEAHALRMRLKNER